MSWKYWFLVFWQIIRQSGWNKNHMCLHSKPLFSSCWCSVSAVLTVFSEHFMRIYVKYRNNRANYDCPRVVISIYCHFTLKSFCSEGIYHNTHVILLFQLDNRLLPFCCIATKKSNRHFRLVALELDNVNMVFVGCCFYCLTHTLIIPLDSIK